MTCRFIELTEVDTGLTYCYNVDIIRSFYKNSDGETFILIAGCGEWMHITASYESLRLLLDVCNPNYIVGCRWDDVEGDTDGDR